MIYRDRDRIAGRECLAERLIEHVFQMGNRRLWGFSEILCFQGHFLSGRPFRAQNAGSRAEPIRARVLQTHIFLFMAAAALFVASFTAAFASPVAFWASPFNSWAAPSAFSLSDPTTLPMPCFALPAASFARPLALSAVLPIVIASFAAELILFNVRKDQSFHNCFRCEGDVLIRGDRAERSNRRYAKSGD
jgi:hypothetical protein